MFDAENDIVGIISVQLKHVFQDDPSLNHFSTFFTSQLFFFTSFTMTL